MPLQIYGRHGSLQMDLNDGIALVSDKLPSAAGPGRLHLHARPPVGAPRPPLEGMAGAIDHLLECLSTGAQPLTHGEDARRSLELVEAAYQSLREGRAVRLPLVPAATGGAAGE
jgi:predicted dehydrogenase